VGRNFDEVHPEDRSFTIGGEEFEWEPMWWRDFGNAIEQAVAEVQERESEETAHQKAVEDAIAKGETPPPAPASTTVVDSYERVIREICRYVSKENTERLKTVLEDPEKRISSLQLGELRTWLQEVAHNRPTEQPSESADGPGNEGLTLRAV